MKGILLTLFALAIFGSPVRGYTADQPQALHQIVSTPTKGLESESGSSMHLVERFALAMAFVGVIAGIGWWLVASARGGSGFAFFQRQGRNGAFRINVLGYRRITARLSIVAVEVPPGTVIILADNGHSLTKLHEAPIQRFERPVEC